jgi:hypothetical protein
MRRNTALLVSFSALSILLAACNDESVLPEPVVETPLALDPSDDVQVAEWYTNGRELLHLYGDGRYALHGTMNRYETAIERGRWSKGGYAVIWLEPYTTQHERIRVSLNKVDTMIVLNVPKHGVMKPQDQPPTVLEDRVIGVWMGDPGTLRLTQDLQFEFTQKPSTAGATNNRYPTQGSWRVVGHDLELRPLSPAYETVLLKVNTTGDGLALVGLEGTFRRASSRMTSESNAQPE